MQADSRPNIELLEDYVNGLLSSEGRTQVESMLEKDENLRAIVAGLQETLKTHGSTEILREYEQAAPAGLIDEKPPSRKRGSLISIAWVTAAAAAAVLLFVFVLADPSVEELAEQHIEAVYDMDLVVRGEAADDVAHAFQAGNYQRVVELADGGKLIPMGVTASTALQVGIASLKTGDLEGASRWLRVERDADPLYGPANKWYRALLEIERGEHDAAQALLQQIQVSGSFRSAEAKQLLDAYHEQ